MRRRVRQRVSSHLTRHEVGLERLPLNAHKLGPRARIRRRVRERRVRFERFRQVETFGDELLEVVARQQRLPRLHITHGQTHG